MAKIVIFDSGLGSLSIIKPIQKKIKSDIIYFADQKNFPYGTKSELRLKEIIEKTIIVLKKRFDPDLIVIGSNTPSILLKNILKKSKVLGVLPPLKEAVENTRSCSIAILATKSVAESKSLKNYVRNNVPPSSKVITINASPLVELVESIRFVNDKKICEKKIKKLLFEPFKKHNVDVVTLSSTHLPFLLPLLKKIFPNVIFLDPANTVANEVTRVLRKKKSTKNTISIFASGDVTLFQRKLSQMGFNYRVRLL